MSSRYVLRHALLAFTLAATTVPVLAADKADKAAGAAAAAAAPPAAAPANNAEILAEKARADKKLLFASNMGLTETEAKAFWPLYEEYQQGIADLNTRNLKAMIDFMEAAKKGVAVDDASKKLIDDTLAAEQGEADLRRTMAPKLLKVLPPIKVARYLQLENKVRAAVRSQLAARIPLAGGPLVGPDGKPVGAGGKGGNAAPGAGNAGKPAAGKPAAAKP